MQFCYNISEKYLHSTSVYKPMLHFPLLTIISSLFWMSLHFPRINLLYESTIGCSEFDFSMKREKGACWMHGTEGLMCVKLSAHTHRQRQQSHPPAHVLANTFSSLLCSARKTSLPPHNTICTHAHRQSGSPWHLCISDLGILVDFQAFIIFVSRSVVFLRLIQ